MTDDGARQRFSSPRCSSQRFSQLRREYAQKSLDVGGVAADPLDQCDRWLLEAADRGIVEPNAMVLATVSPEGRPSTRAVLLKGLDDRGLVFFSNYASRKGQEITHTPKVALLFLWPELERQIRIEGMIQKTSEEESDRYFASRPRGAQVSAYASQQSAPIEDRGILERRMHEIEARYAGQPIPRPATWGGYRVIPDYVEFWQGRENRLHDRIVYELGEGGWSRKRLQP